VENAKLITLIGYYGLTGNTGFGRVNLATLDNQVAIMQ
jgi:hypothetical protein